MSGFLQSSSASGGGPAGSGGVTYFVDGVNGKVGNNGLSPSTAFKDIATANSIVLLPGQSMLFAGGQTFSGALVASVSALAGPTANITYGSYGGGQATISSGSADGFLSLNQDGVTVRDLIFTGNGAAGFRGIHFQNTDSKVHFNVAAINCQASGYGDCGLFVESGLTGTGSYDGVTIQFCKATNCCSATTSGITNAGIWVAYGSSNVLCQFSSATNNSGATDSVNNGNGIKFSQVTDGLIDRCKADSNGVSCNSSGGDGPGGIFIIYCTRVTIVKSTSTNNSTATVVGGLGHDGNGIDIDANCVDCSMIDCYTSGNYGRGLMLFTFNSSTGGQTWNNNRMIDCTSVNDGVGGSSSASPIGLSIGRDAGTTSMTNLLVSGCQVYQGNSNAFALGFLEGSNASPITGQIISNRISAVSSSQFITGTIPPSLLFLDVMQWTNDTFIPYNSDNAEFKTAYFAAFTGVSGNEPGLYVGLNGDAHSRLVAILDGSNNPFIAFSTGAAGSDTSISRGGSASINFGAGTAGDSSAALNAQSIHLTSTASGLEQLEIDNSSHPVGVNFRGTTDGTQISNYALSKLSTREQWVFSFRDNGSFLIYHFDGVSTFVNSLFFSNAGLLQLPQYTTPGILVNDASGNVTTKGSVTNASVPGNFSANRIISINIGGTTYNIPADTATW